MCGAAGSNDRSLRTWSLGALSLAGELEPPCRALLHFGLGDLQVGITILLWIDKQILGK